MQPVVFWQPGTMRPLPVSPSAPETLGQDTVVLTLEELQSPGSWALRYEGNRKVLPELSARCSGTIAVAGSDTPGLSGVVPVLESETVGEAGGVGTAAVGDEEEVVGDADEPGVPLLPQADASASGVSAAAAHNMRNLDVTERYSLLVLARPACETCARGGGCLPAAARRGPVLVCCRAAGL